MKQAASDLMALGIATLPVQANKAPYNVATWKNGVTDLNAYFGAFGVGVCCGKSSNGLECLDFDNHFGDAKNRLSSFIQQVDELHHKHSFVIQSTQSGGYHLLFYCEYNEGNQKLAQKPKWSEKQNKFVPDATIETRGEGGYFIIDPTPGYKVVRGSIEKIPVISKQERQQLIDTAKTFNEWYELRKEEPESEGRPGDLYNQSSEAASEAKDVLRQAGWNEVRPGQWRRPDKSDGISGTFGKVAEGVFYCFTSNGYPFEPNKAYTPFQVVTLLSYGGDFKQHAKELGARYNVQKPTRQAEVKKERTQEEIIELVGSHFIDFRTPVNRPPVAIRIQQHKKGTKQIEERRLFTMGNFSAITGKSKSKKTYLSTMLLACAIKSGDVFNKFKGSLPESKNKCILIDTEQGAYDAYMTARRIYELSQTECMNFGAMALRKFEPLERCEMIEATLKLYNGTIGYMVIDGIADLAKSINDEEEAVRVVGLLMKWTEIYQCHITVIIHQNKNDNFATGFLGSTIMKKCEAIISVAKNEDDAARSTARCDMIRGTGDFDDFEFRIDENGNPVIDELQNLDSDFKTIESPF